MQVFSIFFSGLFLLFCSQVSYVNYTVTEQLELNLLLFSCLNYLTSPGCSLALKLAASFHLEEFFVTLSVCPLLFLLEEKERRFENGQNVAGLNQISTLSACVNLSAFVNASKFSFSWLLSIDNSIYL